jgi:hypothetical protein
MKERAFSDGLKQATDPHPKKSMHQGIDPAHPVTRSKTPLRLCARFSGSEWGGIPPLSDSFPRTRS